MQQETISPTLSSLQCRLVECIPLLSLEDCDRVCDAILSARDNWCRRHPVSEFFTLGTASYLDAANGRFAEYQKQAQITNRILHNRFKWLYQRLASAMCAFIGEKCLYDDALAYPGFHIFLGDDCRKLSASRHYDLEDRNIDWTRCGIRNIGRHLSFTLALRLPPAGSGLYTWNINNLQLQNMPPEDRHEYLQRNQKPSYHEYEIGRVTIHDGHYLHQIARVRQMVAGDQRITMQGHSVATQKGWLLYW